MEFFVDEVFDDGNDILRVVGHYDDDTENPITVTGWVSALTNHYDDNTLDENGHRLPSATPREMTAEEKLAYCKSLAAVPTSTPLEIRG